jgi:hypothetical protein
MYEECLNCKRLFDHIHHEDTFMLWKMLILSEFVVFNIHITIDVWNIIESINVRWLDILIFYGF